MGLPGNDDTGTMSAWLVFAMMGIYPISPGEPVYTITTPIFDRISIQLDSGFYEKDLIVIERNGKLDDRIDRIELDGKVHQNYFILHKDLTKSDKLNVITK
jgi:putative alpha-1,2-mannosidase